RAWRDSLRSCAPDMVCAGGRAAMTKKGTSRLIRRSSPLCSCPSRCSLNRRREPPDRSLLRGYLFLGVMDRLLHFRLLGFYTLAFILRLGGRSARAHAVVGTLARRRVVVRAKADVHRGKQ